MTGFNKNLPAVIEDLNLTNSVIVAVGKELIRQRLKWGVQYHSNYRWLPILLEEVGEVAEALQKDSIAYKETDADDLSTELVQVAAVAISWAARLKAEQEAPGGERG